MIAMSKHWSAVKDAIENEIDKTWWTEPLEVTMSRNLVVPSGAGTDGQCMGNLFFLVSDTQAMGWWTAAPAIQQAIKDPEMSLETCKKMWVYINKHMCHLMGDSTGPGTKCPAPWLNLPKFTEFCDDIIDSFETIETKDDFWDLIWSWQNYVNCMNRWFQNVFPWELGLQLKRQDAKRLELLTEYNKAWGK